LESRDVVVIPLHGEELAQYARGVVQIVESLKERCNAKKILFATATLAL
jgi:hypothetical protein